jgi:hypothetical protein
MIYCPISFQNNAILGIIKVTNASEPFEEDDAKLMKIITSNLAQFLFTLRNDFYERVNVQKKLEATMISSQFEST